MKTLRAMDRVLLICLFCLAALGTITLFAALHQGDISLWQRQNIFWAIGLVIFFSLCFVPLRMTGLACWPVYLVTLLCLALVPLIGDVQMGARRWLNLGLFNLQPSELMKWALMLILAHWFASREPGSIVNLSVAAALTIVPTALIVIQPDLGTALVLLLAATALLVAAGFPWRWLFFATIGALISLPVLWHNMHAYQKKRVLGFLDPQSDPLGAGYHVIQSSIAIGSGGIFGKGFLNGTQSRLHFLPEQHTDFIFAVLAEEGGLLAVLLLLILYGVLISRILIIGSRAHSRFASLLCMGVASIFILYISVNIGMVSGLMPVVGVPLPFISYGGSALITMLAALGLVMRTAIESRDKIPWQRPGSPLI
ncbi:MAG: rod shape-determining protein RodA [Mariprofundaceae bacterium]